MPPQQKWVLRHMAAGATLSTDGGSMCLTIDGKEASITPCAPAKTTQIIDFGRANETVSQIKVRVAVAVFGTRGWSNALSLSNF